MADRPVTDNEFDAMAKLHGVHEIPQGKGREFEMKPNAPPPF